MAGKVTRPHTLILIQTPTCIRHSHTYTASRCFNVLRKRNRAKIPAISPCCSLRRSSNSRAYTNALTPTHMHTYKFKRAQRAQKRKCHINRQPDLRTHSYIQNAVACKIFVFGLFKQIDLFMPYAKGIMQYANFFCEHDKSFNYFLICSLKGTAHFCNLHIQ